jgi:hypothetical protein
MRLRQARAMRLRSLAVALLAPLMLASCGEGQTTARVAGHRLTLTLSEYRITPQTASVPAGALEIVAHNRGILTHNVALQRGSLDSSERSTLADIPTLLPGASGSATTEPLAPGRYLLLSTVGNQAALGMAATLIVR